MKMDGEKTQKDFDEAIERMINTITELRDRIEKLEDLHVRSNGGEIIHDG